MQKRATQRLEHDIQSAWTLHVHHDHCYDYYIDLLKMNYHVHHEQAPPVNGDHQNHNHRAHELHPQHLECLQTLQMHSQEALAEPLGQYELFFHNILCLHLTPIMDWIETTFQLNPFVSMNF